MPIVRTGAPLERRAWNSRVRVAVEAGGVDLEGFFFRGRMRSRQ